MAKVEVSVQLTTKLPWVWRHQCGHLNEGAYKQGDVCSGCSSDIKYPEEIEARYLLVETGD